ncbi:MAG TPA: DEAD/DEAH box helicase, partial [Chlamydiales bacterium]|nr:DEAD/DEAH box helicase [Chlamydiales bacterium]
LAATQAIKADMMSEKAMDRLVCGDVGYGKTEVAMRAAVKTVLDGNQQVAVLVPTTVLAMQHYETFRDRVADFPIRVGVLSRFVSAKQIKQTLNEIETGAVDIVIGTHRIISKDIQFKNLGLIVIDEEQRFGVRAKEHLKKIKDGVNCLTMTATPIPRTLYLSLTGGRDLSTINTPPLDRLPIKTIISERHNETIKNALRRELARDGQAYFIHNRVESIFLIASELQKLVPAARIIVAHGQMSAEEIDTAFHRFKKGEADILVATTLVENGIDIPNANTILIDRAHTFGLSDLYQLRGRVGRWNKASYAYFLIPEKRQLPEHAQKRLQALVESSSFGGGMKLAMRDLEIRGSGDILGTQQSGHLSQIGFHLYCKLLKRAMHALKTKKPASFLETKLEFPFPANLPASYIPETSLRLEIYHRLGDVTSIDDIDAINHELTDRFGTPPSPVHWLLALTRIRLKAQERHYTLLKFTATTLIADQQRGKKIVRTTHKLPQLQNPTQLQAHVDKILQLT